MIESPARVTRSHGDTAWVISEAPSSCGACAGKGCGSSVFSRLWHPDTPEYPVANPIQAQPGEAVVIGLPEGSLLHATALGYVLPLLATLAGAGLGQWLFGELAAALGSLTGLLLAGLWLKRRTQDTRQPVILRRGTPRCANGSH